MNRRTLLAGASGGVVALLAGCTGASEPAAQAGGGDATSTTAATTTKSDAASGSSKQKAVDDPAAVFTEMLGSEYDIQVAGAEHTPEAFTFQYHSKHNDVLDMYDELGSIIAMYAALHDSVEGGLADATGTILAPPEDGSENGRVEIKASWASDFVESEDSATYYSRVEETVTLDGVAKFVDSEYVEKEYSHAVVGQIKNTSGLPLSFLEITAKYYNEAGNVVGNGMDNVSGLDAGETYEFELYVGPDAGVAEYDLEWGM